MRWGIPIHADVEMDHISNGTGGALCGARERTFYETDPDMTGRLCWRCRRKYEEQRLIRARANGKA